MRSRAVGEDTVAVAAAIWVAVSAAPVWAPGLEWDISATGLSDAVLRVGILIGVSGATLLSGPAGITDAATATPIIAPTAAICQPTELRQHRQPSAAMSARSRPDFPSLRRLTTCPLCGGDKPRGLLVSLGATASTTLETHRRALPDISDSVRRTHAARSELCSLPHFRFDTLTESC
jgi:hypothetical protein